MRAFQSAHLEDTDMLELFHIISINPVSSDARLVCATIGPLDVSFFSIHLVIQNSGRGLIDEGACILSMRRF